MASPTYRLSAITLAVVYDDVTSFRPPEERTQGVPADALVGVQAQAMLTVRQEAGITTRIPLTSPGVWGIDDETLYPGRAIPADHWVREWYAEEEEGIVATLITALTGAMTEEEN
jgi:hypothetical protein